MKYAVPIIRGMVSPHFGHCEQFALFDIDSAKNEITARDDVKSPGHEPGVLPKWLAGKGVSHVVAGGMGSRAQDLFSQHGITVIAGITEQDPRKAVMSHLKGALTTGSNLCDH